MQFTATKVYKFEGNTFNGIFKGLKLLSGTIASISNCTFLNMIQNKQENDAVQSILANDGSAIGKRPSITHSRNY